MRGCQIKKKKKKEKIYLPQLLDYGLQCNKRTDKGTES
jgi:hypothetical protein